MNLQPRCSFTGLIVSICPPPFPPKTHTLTRLKSHQRQHNKDKPFKCSNCFRAYSDSASLQTHLPAHAIKNAKAYCCSMCGRAYTSVSQLTPVKPERLKPAMGQCVSLCPSRCVSPGDVPHEAHVQTHHGGTYGLPPLASARHRRFHHSPADLPHLRPPHSPHGRSPQDSYLSNRFKPTNGTQICARSVRRSDNELFLLFLVADQTVLSGTPKDDFSALLGLETTGLCTSFCTRLHRKKKLRQLTWKSVIFFYINDLRLPKSELKYFYIFASKMVYCSLSGQVNWKLNASCIFYFIFLPLSVSVCRISSPD